MGFPYKMNRLTETQISEQAALPSVSDEQAIAMIESMPTVDLSRIEHRIEDRFSPEESTVDEIMRKDLNDKQLRAIDLIISGMSDQQVAETVRVHRVTVTRWRLYHPSFVGEINRRRDNLMQQHAVQLLQMTTRALAVLQERLGDPGKPELQMKAAFSLLRLVGMGRLTQQRGPTSPDDIIEEIAFEKRRKQKFGLVDHGEREEALIDLARRAESAEGVMGSADRVSPASTETARNEHASRPARESRLLPKGQGPKTRAPAKAPASPLLQNATAPVLGGILRSDPTSVTLPVPQFKEEGAIFHGI